MVARVDERGLPARLDSPADAGKMTWPSAVGPARARQDARDLVGEAVALAASGAAADLIARMGARILRG